jgi:hypothetical protein
MLSEIKILLRPRAKKLILCLLVPFTLQFISLKENDTSSLVSGYIKTNNFPPQRGVRFISESKWYDRRKSGTFCMNFKALSSLEDANSIDRLRSL